MSKKVVINETACKACGRCVFFCKDKAIFFGGKFNSSGFRAACWNGTCSFCGQCYIVCPDAAIEVRNEEVMEG